MDQMQETRLEVFSSLDWKGGSGAGAGGTVVWAGLEHGTG